MILRSLAFISFCQNLRPFSHAAEKSLKPKNNLNGINTPKKKV
jgi:hypothetical protein